MKNARTKIMQETFGATISIEGKHCTQQLSYPKISKSILSKAIIRGDQQLHMEGTKKTT
jgi:hypothetical protein